MGSVVTRDDPDPFGPDAGLHVRAVPRPGPFELDAAAVDPSHDGRARRPAGSALERNGRARGRGAGGLRARDAGDLHAPRLLGPLPGRRHHERDHLHGRRPLPDRPMGHRTGRRPWRPRADLSSPRCGGARAGARLRRDRTPTATDRDRRLLSALWPGGPNRRLRRGGAPVRRDADRRRHPGGGNSRTRPRHPHAVRTGRRWIACVARRGRPRGDRGRVTGQGPWCSPGGPRGQRRRRLAIRKRRAKPACTAARRRSPHCTPPSTRSP